MELHFLDERIAKLEAIRSEADCKSISYLVDKVIQKIHDTTGVVFLLNRYGSGFVQENFSQHQSIHCSQPRFKYEKEGADGYRNTVQTMMRQISIDSLTLALKTLPDVINNDILAYNIDEIDIEKINEKLSILIDLAHVEGDVPLSSASANNSWLTPLNRHTDKKINILLTI